MVLRVLACCTFLVLAGCSLSTGEDRAQYTARGAIRVIPPADRGDPVRISGKDLADRPVSLPLSSDRATVLNIWWSGCAECRQEAPDLRALSSDPDIAAVFYGIDVRETSQDAARRFEERVDLGYPSFFDPGGQALLQLHGKASLVSIPTTVVLDRRMRVAAVIYGAVPGPTTFGDIVANALR